MQEIRNKMPSTIKTTECTSSPKLSLDTYSTGFELKGLHILKAFMNSSFYTLALSYTFRWNRTTKKFHLVEFLPQKVLSATFAVLFPILYVYQNWNQTYLVSSRKEDLIQCFKVVRNFSSVLSYGCAVYTIIWKGRDFLKLLNAITPKIIENEACIRQRRQFVTSFAIYFATALSFGWGFLPILQQGYHEATVSLLENWPNNNSLDIPSLVKYIPDKGSWASIFVDFAVLAVTVQSNLSFWSFLFFNFVFTVFIRSNLKSFKTYLENVEVVSQGQIYNEYLFLKSLVEHTNKYIGPRVFALFFSLIPFCSFFLSSFTELAESHVLIFFVIWAAVIWSTFFLAANTSLQTGEIKRVLITRKQELEKICGNSSDITVMLMDMPIGNELGISCCGCFIMDYSLIGSMLTSIFTFAIIAIQAK